MKCFKTNGQIKKKNHINGTILWLCKLYCLQIFQFYYIYLLMDNYLHYYIKYIRREITLN